MGNTLNINKMIKLDMSDVVELNNTRYIAR